MNARWEERESDEDTAGEGREEEEGEKKRESPEDDEVEEVECFFFSFDIRTELMEGYTLISV